jgi:hypothetical protein
MNSLCPKFPHTLRFSEHHLKQIELEHLYYVNSMVLHPVVRVSQKFVELHRTHPLFIVFHSFILMLIIRHVSAHFQAISVYYTCKKSSLNMA